jgi:APA family basic amino acid/polyamine antiporter
MKAEHRVTNPGPAKSGMTHRKNLEKVITFKNYIAIALGAIIGVGWIIYAGEWLLDGGPIGAMLAFILGGILLIPIGKCYAELTPAIPVAGGELAFSYKAFGIFVSFLTAWLLAFNYTFVLPFETIAIGALFESMLPGLKTPVLYIVGDNTVRMSSILPGLFVGLCLIVLNYRGVKNSARFQMFAMGLMLSCVLVFTCVALFKGNVSHFHPLFAHGGPLWTAIPASVISVIVVVPWFMAGFDSIPQAAEESGHKVQPQDLGKAIIMAIVIGILFYIVVIMDVSLSMPWQESYTYDLPTAAVFRVAFGYEWAAQLVLFAGILGLITTLNGFYIASSRLIFAQGRGGLLPQWFGEVHEKYHTPKNAIIFVGIISLIGPFLGKAALTPIVNSSSLAFVFSLSVTSLSAVRLRKTAPSLARPYKVKSTMTLYLGFTISIILVLLMLAPRSPGQLSPLEFAIIGFWFITGLCAYLWRRKKKDMSKEERDIQILGDYR